MLSNKLSGVVKTFVFLFVRAPQSSVFHYDGMSPFYLCPTINAVTASLSSTKKGKYQTLLRTISGCLCCAF